MRVNRVRIVAYNDTETLYTVCGRTLCAYVVADRYGNHAKNVELVSRIVDGPVCVTCGTNL